MGEESKLKPSPNTPELLRVLQHVTTSALKAGGEHIVAVAVVVALPNGELTASFGGMGDKKEAMATLLALGPDVLRDVIDRAISGRGGITKLIDPKTDEVLARTQGGT